MISQFRILVNLLLSICFITAYTVSEAQPDHSLGDWNILVLKGSIAPKWSFLCEDHIRNNNSNYNFKYDYFESKLGIYYSLTSKLLTSLGAGYFDKYTTGGFFKSPELQREIRTWLELYFKNSFSRIFIDHRLRIEQRYLPETYKNRLKYRLGLVLPLNKLQIREGTFYLAVNDELFIPQYGPFIERNYFFAGAGYVFTGNMAFQIGCLKDLYYRSGIQTVKNYLQLIVIYDLRNILRKRS